MPGIVEMRTLYEDDGITPIGMGVTMSDGNGEFVVSAENCPGETPSEVEVAATGALNAQFPHHSWHVHCFSVNPFSIAIQCRSLGDAPMDATWWRPSPSPASRGRELI
jgi:hypothetical protein